MAQQIGKSTIRLMSGSALALLITLAACSDPATSVDSPVSADSAATAAVAKADTQSAASTDAKRNLDGFLAANGADFDTCFASIELELQGPPEGPDLVEPGGAGVAKASRVIVALDSSGSMAGKVGGETKMAAAKDAVRGFLETIPDTVAVGLVAFGHTGNNEESGKSTSCAGAAVLSAASENGAQAINAKLLELDATGWTPLADAISVAGDSLTPSSQAGEQVVYVVSDGKETCDGDPVAAAKALHESDVRAVINIIGFDLPAADRRELMSVAEAGGGSFVEVDSGAALREALRAKAANVGEMTRVRASVGNAMRKNNVAAGQIKNDLIRCVGDAKRSETNAFRDARKQAGDSNDAGQLWKETYDLMRARHAMFDEKSDQIRDVVDGHLDGKQQEIRDVKEDAESANDELR